jgi:hypothetical protein
VIVNYPERVFAFDEFGPLVVHPVGGCCWAEKKKPQRNWANYKKPCGVSQFHGCNNYCAFRRHADIRVMPTCQESSLSEAVIGRIGSA